MSLVLNVEILGEFKKLTQATQGAQNSLSDMNKRAQSVSKSITRAFGAIGLGLSFKFLANELEDAAKAAIEDTKSQVLLANALKNTMDVSDEQIKSIEKTIKAYQFSASVADDELRPAYQKLALATKDTTRANELLGIALDVAAGTGKGLDVVSQAMAKSLAGSDTALLKLIPSLKGSKTPMEDLAAAFGGAAEKAANVDPYQRMKIIFDDLQETVGMALLPTLEKFASWIASPEGQEKLQKFIDLVTGLAGKFEVLAGFVIDNADAFIAWSGVIVGVGIAFKVFTGIMTVYNGIAAITAARNAAVAASQVAIGTTATTAAGGVTALNTSLSFLLRAFGTAALVLALGGDAPKGGGTPQQRDNEGRVINTKPNSPLLVPQPTPAPGFNFQRQSLGAVTINVNNPNATASDIIKKLDDYYTATGTRPAQ
jgi:hypothetical protein